MKLKSKPTSDQISSARRGGFKGKRPKKPKANASLSVLERWGERYNGWVDKVNGARNDNSHREKLKNEIRRV